MPSSDFIGTYNGGKFWVTEPRVKDVDIEAIAHGLSQNCRFNGHTSFNWTVAQHSLLVADIINEQDFSDDRQRYLASLVGLLHDASEGYMSDIASPFKCLLTQYLNMEEAVQNTIYKACGINYSKLSEEIKATVKEADLLALHIEAKLLMNPCKDWLKFGDFKNPKIEQWESHIKLENPQVVKGKFLKRLFILMRRLGLFSKSKIFTKLGDEWYMFIVCDSIPIFINGICKLFVVEDTENDAYLLFGNDSYNIIANVNRAEIDNMQSLDKYIMKH